MSGGSQWCGTQICDVARHLSHLKAGWCFWAQRPPGFWVNKSLRSSAKKKDKKVPALSGLILT